MKLIPKLQTCWQPINQQAVKEWSDNWKSRTTKSRVLQGRGVESDKQYTERRKRETAPQRTWLSNAADIAHGVRETALAMHPLTAIPYFGAKVGQDFLNGNVSWQTAVNATVPLFHFTPTPSASTVINSTLEDLANAGSKTARNIRVARELKNNVKQTKLPYQEYAPTIRTRVGDVEVDNPNLFYRVGTKDIVEDFNKTGKVRAGETNHQNPISSGGISLKKHTYPNPMFKEGSLWYQPSEEINGLLISNGKFQYAGKHSNPINYDMGRRRIPAEELNSSNTTAYTWKPSYGYKKVQQKSSTIQFPSQSNGIPVNYGSQPVPIGQLIQQMKIKSPMTRQQKIDYLKTQQKLAQRVDRARDFDAVQLTKGRLKNGGFDKLIYNLTHRMKGEDIDYSGYFLLQPFNNQLKDISIQQKILKSHPHNQFTSQQWNKILKRSDLVPEHGGIGSPLQFYGWFKNSKHLNKRNIGAAHEFSHYVYHPYYTPKGLNFSPEFQNYFMKHGATEIQARGTQLKNYFGLKKEEKLTPEMWEYASKHYIKDTGLNNNMTELFNSVNNKSSDFPLFLQWLNKHSLKQGGKL